MIDLGAIASTYNYSAAWWIDDGGTILGQSTGSDGQTHIVSWTLIPEPTTAALLALGLVGIAAGWRRVN